VLPFRRSGFVFDAPAQAVGEKDEFPIAGFMYTCERGGPAYSTFEESRHFLRIPYWFLMTVAGSIPLLHGIASLTRHWNRRRERFAGHCPTCGYDLRATSERCPECGTAAATPAAR